MLQWLIRIVTVLAAAALAYGWGGFATEPDPLAATALLVLTAVLVAALVRLYRPGGVAAFEFDDEVRRAPGEPVAAGATTARAPSPRPPAPRPARPAPAPMPANRRSGGSLWSSDRPAPADTALVDLNHAGVADLSPLPGIGRIWAQRIVEDREAHGAFASLEDLTRVDGFNPAKLDALEGRLSV